MLTNHSGNKDRSNSYRLRERVRDVAQPPLLIAPITLADPAIAEIAGFAGADALMLDCEHGMLGPETVRSMLVHAQAAHVPAIFRPRSFDAAACRQALDQGAAGVHVPHVDSREQTLAVVNACRYAPLGKREMSLGRAVQYDGAKISSYVAQANEHLLVAVMIESVVGLKNVEAIASVPGIDVIHLGIADLSHDMGYSGQFHHPDVVAATERVLDVAASYGVAVGYPTQDPQLVEHWATKGIRYFEMDTPDYLLREVYGENFSALKQLFEKLPADRIAHGKQRDRVGAR